MKLEQVFFFNRDAPSRCTATICLVGYGFKVTFCDSPTTYYMFALNNLQHLAAVCLSDGNTRV